MNFFNQIRARRTKLVNIEIIVVPRIFKELHLWMKISIYLNFLNGLVNDHYVRTYEQKIRLAYIGVA